MLQPGIYAEEFKLTFVVVSLAYRLGEFDLILYLKFQSFEFLITGTPAIPCSIL